MPGLGLLLSMKLGSLTEDSAPCSLPGTGADGQCIEGTMVSAKESTAALLPGNEGPGDQPQGHLLPQHVGVVSLPSAKSLA